MKHRWIWAMLFGSVLGVVVGFFLGLWLLSPLPEPKQAPVAETFDFREAVRKAGHDSWQVMRDGEPRKESNWYHLGPWKGESSAITRHMAARTRMSEGEQREFVRQFRTVLEEEVRSHDAQADFGNDGSSDTKDEGLSIKWSRYQYYRGGMRGMIEMVMVGQGEEVTLFLVFAEVRATARSWPMFDIPLFRRSSGMP